MIDFTYKTLALLIRSLLSKGYDFQNFGEHLQRPSTKSVILRHDIDIFAASAIPLAKLEFELGVSGTYYFRTTKYSCRPDIIMKIAKMNHEIGYHYEDLARNNGDMATSIIDFETNLTMFRKLYPIKTVCMHGSSGSPYDNRDLWVTYKLQDFGLIGEPYLSLNFDKVLYISDTTQRWDGGGIAVRDKVSSGLNLSFVTTQDILDNITRLPDNIMITIHPELWSGNPAHWLIAKAFVFVHSNYKRFYRNRRTARNPNFSNRTPGRADKQ